jgi:hypothetical protein
MGYFLKRAVLFLVVAGFFSGADFAVANPLGDFFKRLGNSIAHPKHTPTPRPSLRKGNTQTKPGDTQQQTVPPEAPPTQPSVAPAPAPTPTPVSARAASSVAPTQARRDMPYGIPVAGRPGFVTSPYSPKSGYVDVRGFPSGTEVKDPYTGKIFLTP